VDGQLDVSEWDFCKELFDNRIAQICDEVGGTQAPLLFMTNTKYINSVLNKNRQREEKPPVPFVDNFRFEAAKQKDYKGNRKTTKPFHFKNLITHAMTNYNVVVNEEGIEADDALCVYQIDTAKEYGVKVPFSGGHFLIDYEDWLKYSSINWSLSNGYLVNDTGRNETRKVTALHRLILGDPQGYVVDHINGDKLDNRKYNLRICTEQQNRHNSAGQKNSKSGYKGVSWHSGKNKWESSIRVDNKLLFLGNFLNIEEAALAYDTAAKTYFKEFARLNFEPPYVKPFKETIICSRDKDVRQCPGWHYSWECGKQASIGPIFVEPLGTLDLKSPKKLFGTGDKFFYAQMIMGDSVDNVGGLKGRGAAFAYTRLKDCESSRECYESVAELYVNFYQDNWQDVFREQADLMWMIREKDDNGYVKWKVPKNDEQ
jgi:hypothetical protein